MFEKIKSYAIKWLNAHGSTLKIVKASTPDVKKKKKKKKY
jgi:hypothetical protein